MTQFLNNKTDAFNLWREIGSNYDNIEQSINELIDNAISNIEKTNPAVKKVQISFTETEDADNSIILEIEDSGNGIENLDAAFSLAEVGTDTVRNEHGFGFKQALAAANPENDAWEICTRYSDNPKYLRIKAPYKLEKQQYENVEDNWPGEIWSNTFVRTKCKYQLFENLSHDGSPENVLLQFDFKYIADRIYEDLGVTYSDIMQQENIEITLCLISSDGNKKSYKVTPLLPLWTEKTKIIDETLKITCTYGRMDKLPPRILFNNATSSRYYCQDQLSNGIEIRINGRMIENNLVREIYDIKNHHALNRFLAQVNIISDNKDDLPKTRTTKNGFRVGDKKLQEIHTWLRVNVKPERMNYRKKINITEKQQKRKLSALLENKIEQDFEKTFTQESNVIEEFEVFKNVMKSHAPKADLLMKENGKITIFECKREEAACLDVYQLIMYCEGYFSDYKRKADHAILVAKDFPEGVLKLIALKNTEKSVSRPTLQFKCWNDFEENYVENMKLKKAALLKK